jgi:hypothetical protein
LSPEIAAGSGARVREGCFRGHHPGRPGEQDKRNPQSGLGAGAKPVAVDAPKQ